MSTAAGALQIPRGLYLLCDDTVRPELPLVRKAELLVQGGARVIQLRMKRLSNREAVLTAREVVQVARRAGCLCIVNDRVDWALLSDADGVHLGEDDLPVPDARRLLGPARLVGATTRTLADIERAKDEGADHVGLGPVFGTQTKTVNARLLGVEALSSVCAHAPLPVVAIAGITLANIEEVAAAGAHSAAVASDALLSDDIPARVRALIAAFARGASRHTLRGT